jgi:hypothetical protein
MSDQLVAEVAAYITNNENKSRTLMPPAKFDPTIPAIKRPQTYALNRTTVRFSEWGVKAKLNVRCINTVKSSLRPLYPRVKNPTVPSGEKTCLEAVHV